MLYKPLIPTAIALVLSTSAIAAAGSVSMTVGNVSVSSSSRGATVKTVGTRTTTTPAVRPYSWHSSQAAAASRARACQKATLQQASHSSGSSTYQSQTSQICR